MCPLAATSSKPATARSCSRSAASAGAKSAIWPSPGRRCSTEPRPVRLIGGLQPTVGATLVVINATGGLAGTKFDQAVAYDPSGAAVWGLQYGATGVSAQLLTLLNGDLNHDTAVNGADWAAYIARCANEPCRADPRGCVRPRRPQQRRQEQHRGFRLVREGVRPGQRRRGLYGDA